MIRPTRAVSYDPIDLKLGIKSSLPKAKATLALLMLLWDCEDEPADIIYAVEDGDGLKLVPEIEERILNRLQGINAAYTAEQLHEVLSTNCLLTSQLEHLMVALELIWRVARIRFVTQIPNSAERTGLKRFPKHIYFTSNMDIVGALTGSDEKFLRVLFSWLGIAVDADEAVEARLIRVLTAFSEEAVYKLVDRGHDVIFNQESLYRTMLSTGQQVDVSGDVEPKGSLRILKSALSEGLVNNLTYQGGLVHFNDRESLQHYCDRVKAFHQIAVRIPGGEVAHETNPADDEEVTEDAHNVLLYGVPGCGKSHTIKTQYCDDESRMERVVFHPDYSHSDFVGQIMPSSVGGHISYPFVPGPFTRILKKAVDTPEKRFYLVIEEINRGNAPAIFGEVFQLLDRKNGESEYGISNSDIAKAVYGDEGHMVKIPANLFILATMNTADQNVFTLDTAFKRRWAMHCIENNFDNCEYRDLTICDSRITWKSFAETINAIIIDCGENSLSSEDKRLGAYFVNKSELQDSTLFSEKVLMYLWNDALKYDRDKLFKSEYRTLEQLLAGFASSKFDVFLDTVEFTEIDLLTEPTTEAEVADDPADNAVDTQGED